MRIAKAIGTRVIVLAAFVGACGDGEAPEAGPDDGTPSAPEVRALTDGLAVWRADGFTMLVPDDADVVPTDPIAPATWAVIVAGPGFVREVDGRRMPGPPAYRLDAATYVKPDTVALEEWVAARLAERQSAGDAQEEPDAASGVTVALAGEAALRTGTAPGIEGTASYWLERNGKVVELRLDEEPESPLSGIQRHIQSLMLSTFRWSGDSGESRDSTAAS